MSNELLKENLKTNYFWIGLACLVVSFIIYISANSLPFSSQFHTSLYGGQEIVLEVCTILSLIIFPPLLKAFKVDTNSNSYLTGNIIWGNTKVKKSSLKA